ncbi:DUF305 domain-containing protein [Microbacterium sp. BLY]|uniref:DUF305 domain-containing protein n=1 Tax=Microbacterium sp. BLY TaxID=2823280 RepID=UPI001B3371DF|nr:DUF305 domain-containing protein [Microbacterium sp. BLY]MBP3977041.1 DUF305 domain-containing protein [Microbacterium sp. BLY]
MKNRTTALAALALAGTLALAGCSGAEPAGPADHSGMDHSSSDAPLAGANEADVMFASMMIVHHEQAVEMSDIVLAKEGVDPRVADLAERITAAQGPEIEQLQGWLEEWGAEPGDSGAMDHGDGMMSDDDLAALEAAAGPEASRLFLEQMIVHHEGAVEMAEAQIADGENADAVALAQDIVDAQTAEIAEMTDILATL